MAESKKIKKFYIDSNAVVHKRQNLNEILDNNFNYDEQEKLIGKWYGDNLYKKTVKFTSGFNYGSETTLSHGISNLKICVDYKAFYIRSDNKFFKVPNLHTSMEQYGTYICNISSIDFLFYVGKLMNGNWTIKELYITFYYTKN